VGNSGAPAKVNVVRDFHPAPYRAPEEFSKKSGFGRIRSVFFSFSGALLMPLGPGPFGWAPHAYSIVVPAGLHPISADGCFGQSRFPTREEKAGAAARRS